MTPESDDRSDELLDDDELLEPDPDQPEPAADEPAAPPQSAEEENLPAKTGAPKEDDGGEAAAPVKPAPATSPRRKSYWHVWAIIFLLLVLAVVGLGWYVGKLRTEVGGLKGDLEAAQSQATGLQSAASQVGEDILPLAEEQAVIAQLRADSGDAKGAAYALAQAKRYVGMAEQLSTTGGRLGEVQQRIDDVAAKLGGAEQSAKPETGAAAGDVPTGQPETPAPTGEEAAPAGQPAEPAPADESATGSDAAGENAGSSG